MAADAAEPVASGPETRPARRRGGVLGARLGWTGLSLLGFGLVWATLAALIGSDELPGPVAVWEALLVQIRTDGYLGHLGATLARVAAAFGLAMVLGAALDRAFGGWLTLFLNLPALVTIILCYVWFGLTEAAALAAVAVNKIPNV